MKPVETVSWLVGFKFANRRGYTRTVGCSIVQRPANYSEEQVRTSLLPSEQVRRSLVPLTRCKSWKKYAGTIWPRCTCQYCRALFVVRHQMQILEG